MTEIKVGGRRRSYIKIAVTPTADGNFRVEEFAVLRTLDPEVKRVYEGGVPYVHLDSDNKLVLVGSGCFWARTGSIINPESVEGLRVAHARLRDIERAVAEYSSQELYIGGDEDALELEVNDWVYYRNPHFPEFSKVELLGPARISEISGDMVTINTVLEVHGYDVTSTHHRGVVVEKFVPDERHQPLLPHKVIGIATCKHADGSEYSWWYVPAEMEVCNADLLLVEHFDGTRSVVRCESARILPTARILTDENSPKCRVLENFHNRVCNIRNVDRL
ncbi:MAG: hypothetical protein HGA67_03820 [Candidatus Yonathbacteria bacterium]|nr:hypothetical protein [Candidatus Yonathbacteria bacterium]